MWKRIGRVFISLYLLVGITVFANQEPYIEVQLDRQHVIQDQIVQVHFLLYSQKEADEIPNWSFSQPHISSDYLMMNPHRSRSITYVNGVMSEKKEVRYSYTYNLRISKSGSYQLNSPQFKVDGYNVPIKVLNIEVSGVEKNPYYSLKINNFPATIYEGERINFNLDLGLSRQISTPRFRLNGLYSLEHSLTNSSKIANPTKVTLNDKVVEGEIVNSSAGQIFRIPLSLVVKEQGSFSLSDGNAGFKGVTANARMGFFGEYEQSDIMIPLEANVNTVRVLALPTSSRPSNFSGLIGNLTLDVVAAPTQLKVGDPLTLTITLGNINDYGFEINPIIKSSDFQNSFKIADAAPGKIDNGQKIFIQTLRPLNSNVTKIPSIKINYFNTLTKRYEELSSSPIDITVAESTTIGEDQIIYNSVAGRELATKYIASREFHNIQGRLTAQSLVSKNQFKFFTKLQLIVSIILASILFLLTLFLILVKSNILLALKKYKESDLYKILTSAIDEISRCNNNAIMILIIKKLRDRVLLVAPNDKSTKKAKEQILRFVDQLLFSNNQIEYEKKDSIVQLLKNVKASLLNSKKGGKIKSVSAATILFFVFCLLIDCSKNPATDIKEIEKIDGLLSKANEEFLLALDLLASSDSPPWGHFKESYNCYKEIVDSGYDTSEIEFNMGNILRFLKDDPMALYHYKKALLLKELPLYKEAVDSLIASNGTNMGKNSFINFIENCAFYFRTYQLFTYVTILLSLLIVLLFVYLIEAIYQVNKKVTSAVKGFSTFLAGLTIVIMLSFLLQPKPYKEGIIISDTDGRGGPSYAYNISLTTALYPTQLFKILESRSGWLYIKLPNGICCWIPQSCAKIIL